jgi:hypothetical protein
VVCSARAVAYTGNFEFRMKFVSMRLAGSLSIAPRVAVVFFGRCVGFVT